MGQPIAVTEKPAARHGMVRFELNRNLTGTGHERYRETDEVTGDRPPDELARRLFATGRVTAVHVYMSVVTIELHPGASAEGLKEIVERLYLFYPEAGERTGGEAPGDDVREATEGGVEGAADDAGASGEAAPDAVAADGG